MKNIIGNKYEFKGILVEGENSIVYDAFDLKNEKQVAVKKIMNFGVSSGTIETQAAASFVHKNIVNYLEVIEEKKILKKSSLYVVMDFIDGISLLPIINYIRKENTRLADDLSVYIIIEVLDALEYIHNFSNETVHKKRDIIHCDISPSNIMINRNGEVKLIDFGISKYNPEKMSSQKKQNILIKGKISHLSPEQAAGGDIDRRSDLYSTGIVLFELLTGISPFSDNNKSTAEVIKYIKEKGISESTIKEKVHNHLLQSILVKVLSKERSQRFQSASEMKKALLPIINLDEKEIIQEEIAYLVGELYSVKNENKKNESTIVKGINRGRSINNVILQNVIIGLLSITVLIILFILLRISATKSISGNIYVSTIPENSSIEFNHKSYKYDGTAPIYIKNIKTGVYPVRCTFKDNSEVEKVVSITSKSSKNDERYVIVNTAPLYILSKPEGAKIFINGSQIEQKTNCRIDLPIDKDVSVKVENEYKTGTCNINVLNETYSVDSSIQWSIFQNSWTGFNSSDSTNYFNILAGFGKTTIVKTIPQAWQILQNGKPVAKLPNGDFVFDAAISDITIEIYPDSSSTNFENRTILLDRENDTIVLNIDNSNKISNKVKKIKRPIVPKKIDLSKLKENIVEISISVKNESNNLIPSVITISYVRIKDSFGKEIKESMKTEKADNSGYFTKFIPAGRYRFRFSAAGYSSLDKFINVGNNQKKAYVVSLKKI